MRLYNIDHLPAVVDNNAPAVMPGDAHDFTDEQAQRLTGLWSEEDPRRTVDLGPDDGPRQHPAALGGAGKTTSSEA
jgi:hypothetical protein